MALGSERQAVQDPLIEYSVDAGWRYIGPSDALEERGDETGALLRSVLVAQLQRLNPGVIDPTRAEEIVGRLSRIAPNIEGNLDAWEYLIGLKTVFVEEESRERNVRLLDPDNVNANTFHVTDEFSFTNGAHTIRPDVVFLINGVPVLIVEAKAATHIEGIAEAFDQIRRYHRQGPELLSVMQLHALTHLVDFYYGATWSLSRKLLFNWRDEAAGNFELLVKSFVDRERLLRVLTQYILFPRKDGELSKAVLRPHQMRAAEAVIERAKDSRKRRGLIWHTQGSGKTYTMISVATQLIRDPALGNPTVLMLVDRNELEEQLFGDLATIGLEHSVAESKRELRGLLASDRRGLIISMIHKFDDIPANLNERENVYVLIDEAHRSTGGDLGNFLLATLPNATYIGFTGTPIDRTAQGQGTFKVFGTDDPSGYTDKYSIRQSIADGTTVPLHYSLAPNELLPDEETMAAEFWSLAEAEGVTDVEELNRVLDRAVNLKNMLKNRDRVEQIAAFVADHFQTKVEPSGYKALVVAPDREGCTLYKEALDRHLPPEYSEVVYSAAHNDLDSIAKYHLNEDEEKEVRKSFRNPEKLPKILIVTEKLLTGFDAPILYCMYLDKPMRDHALLQALARVNRPHAAEGQRKTAGLVVDFIGIFDKLEQALAFDSQDVEGVIEGVEVLQEHFAELIVQGREDYLSLTDGLAGDKATEAVLEHFRDLELRQTYYRYYRELQELYEIISPDAFLRPYIAPYSELGRIYAVLRAYYEPGVSIDRSFMRKTAQLVQEHTHIMEVLEPETTYELGLDALEALANEDRPETVKVFNLIRQLRGLVRNRAAQEPHLRPIGERVEEIAMRFEDRQLTTEQALEELQGTLFEIREAERLRDESGLSVEGAAIAWLLAREEVDDPEGVARASAAAVESFPHWRTSAAQERRLRSGLYALLRDTGVGEAERVVAIGDQLLGMLRGAP